MTDSEQKETRHCDGDPSRWAFLPALRPSRTLFVSFSPSFQPAGRFSHFKRTERLGVHRLFFIDVNNCLYDDFMNEIFEIVERYRQSFDIERIVFWGFSGGAYAALNCGLRFGPRCQTIAISPHLRLNRARTRASELLGNRRIEFPDLRDALSRHSEPNITMLFPCHSLRDWPHIVDSLDLAQPNLKRIYVLRDHGIEADLLALGKLDEVMSAAVNGSEPRFDFMSLATNNDLLLVRTGLRIFEDLEEGRIPQLELPNDENCTNNWWFDIKARYLDKRGRTGEAIAAISQAIRINNDVSQHYVSLGHYMNATAKSEIFKVFYAEAYRKGCRDKWLDDELKNCVLRSRDEFVVNIVKSALEQHVS